MSIEKRTGDETPRPKIGKTHKYNRWVRFVDLNDYADQIVDFANLTYIPLPDNPSDGDALVYNSTTESWEAGITGGSAVKEKVTVLELSQPVALDAPIIDRVISDKIKSSTNTDITYSTLRASAGEFFIDLDIPVSDYTNIKVDIESVTDGDTATALFSEAYMINNTRIVVQTGFYYANLADQLLNKTKLELIEYIV